MIWVLQQGAKTMEVIALIVAFAPFIIICLAAVGAAILFFRKAARNETHKVRNIVIGVLSLMIPAVIYLCLYIFGRILTG